MAHTGTNSMKDDDDTLCYRSELEAAVKAEREACAELCERMARRTEDIRRAALEMAAENIMARGSRPTTVIYSPGDLAARGLTHEDVVKLIKENT